ncbi:MAG: M48 family metallopeptidase, partial [Planctomycetales bacterium]|nr:M48 family metallopeptidase [Planctomycetales bacterium]
AGARIELRPHALVATLSDQHQYTIAYGDCELEIGGFSGRMLFCRGHDESLTIFCEEPGFADALSRAASGQLATQVEYLLAERRRDARRGRGYVAIGLALLCLLLIAGYYGVKAGARAAARALPLSVDRQIGQRAFAAMDLEGPEINDADVKKPLRDLVALLAPHAAVEGLDFEIHVIDADIANAFALPGGVIVVYVGLIEQADNAEQLAGVIGHEMAHATLRHGMEAVSHTIGLATAVHLLLGDASALAAAGADVLQMAAVNSYSREQEAAADQEAVRMLDAAGVNPSGLPEFFHQHDDPGDERPGIVAWLDTHPSHADRVDALESQIRALPPREYHPLAIDWPALQERVAN